ncbi:hypothetical protein JTB14_024358 [Gonioctena quinquepunctata]|nr:hypothetical protein JTB14_024358 [Gonioctena quinquepunctata]
MANFEDPTEYSDFITVRRKNNMRRGKPQQQIYRPGSGPLRKSNNLEESESDTNLVINSRQEQFKKGQPEEFSNFKSEGSSPRNKITVMDHTASCLRDLSLYSDIPKRYNKKPEQMHYVPRPVAQARDAVVPQDSTPDSFAHINGNETVGDTNDRNGTGRSRGYSERNRIERGDRSEWRDHSLSTGRPKRFDQRGTHNGQGQNWNRPRDTRSVEPSGPPAHAYNPEKIQSKPPSGRRHSTVGIEPEKRYTKSYPTLASNFENLPPRLQRKYLADNNIPPPEENWDGSSVTFQSHPKNPSYHQMGGTYNTLPNIQNLHSHHGNVGYHTLPNKSRGRGRLNYDHESQPGSFLNSSTPDRVSSPCNSRPPTPPLAGIRKPDSRPQTPINFGNDHQNRGGQRNEHRYFENNPKEGGPRNADRRDNIERRDNNNRRRDYGNRRYDYGRDARYNRDNHNNWDDMPKDPHIREMANRRDQDSSSRDRIHQTTPGRDSRHQTTPGRDNRHGRGNYNRDRKRNNRDIRDTRENRGNHDARNPNMGYDYSLKNVAAEENWDDECENHTILREMSPVSPEEQFRPIVQPGLGATLDWSEEVELNDKLEAEYLSDALTRSSSIVSLQDISTKSLPPNLNTPSSSVNSKRSGARENSNSSNRNSRSRQNSTTSIDSRDSFKVPYEPRRRRGSREGMRETSYERYQNSSRNISRDSSWDRHHNPNLGTENWREGMARSRKNSEKDNWTNIEEIKNVDPSSKKAGVIVLPQQAQQKEVVRPSTLAVNDHPRYPEETRSPQQQKSLFDHNNPSKPIIVKSSSSRVGVPEFSDNTEALLPQMYTTDQFGNIRPPWYDENSEAYQTCHYPDLLRDVKRADNELQCIINRGWLLVNWSHVDVLRKFLKEALEYLVCRAIKFCQGENIEQHFWKIMYHNIIEVTRKAIKNDSENKEKYKDFLLYLIDDGCTYFEGLLGVLEETYKFKLNNFLGENNMVSHKGLQLVGLALVSAQKLFLFLGDLGRYREEVNETSNYGKCRQWYIKSHEINPKNGKPYNQLAILAVHARRKLDAVYYYMRSLMSSNPVPSARENLNSLFDENRKKYEQGEKKRREERLERQRQQMKQKESDESDSAPGSLRKETWIHPEGGRRVHRTTQANLDQKDSDAEDLAALSSVEVNKRFVISYLHVHGKLITKIGMETFQETAMQMLREFHALLQHSPVPLPCNRFLQLLALNMFAIESTQLKVVGDQRLTLD